MQTNTESSPKELLKDFVIERLKINEIKPAKYNPRIPNKKYLKVLKESVQQFGQVVPLVLNKCHTIIGGHQRLLVYKELKIDDVLCIVSPRQLTEEEEKLLNLYLNRNVGEYVPELLAQNFQEEMLSKCAFSNEEIRSIFALDEKVEGTQEFTKELLEEQNYLVFTFDNVMDWQVAKDKFGIKAVDALDSREGYEKRGVGRVLDGKLLLQ